ncbi:MAG: ATP-binding protein, partial [Enterococcus lemanii]
YSHPQGTIELKAVTEEQAVTLTITDHGIGISASDLPRVKQAFFTGENGRKFGEATGMGLYLVQQVADELGIELTIHSTVGHGTSVALQIPT